MNAYKKLDKTTNAINSSITPSSFRDNPYKNNIRGNMKIMNNTAIKET
jgi:hypothetical protein